MKHASTILSARNVHKTYRLGAVDVPVLKGASLEVREGEWVAILGASGSGKSTLLHLLGDLDRPDPVLSLRQRLKRNLRPQGCPRCGYPIGRSAYCSECGLVVDGGSIQFGGQRLSRMAQRARNHYRNRSVGFVFQFYHLLPELNVLDNTLLPGMIGRSLRWWLLGATLCAIGLLIGAGIGWLVLLGVERVSSEPVGRIEGFLVIGSLLGLVAALLLWPRLWLRRGPGMQQQRERAAELLRAFGLGHRLHHRPRELSGGERQRVAIARALINSPRVLLADEPTGNLDEKTGAEILDLIAQQHQRGLTIVMVTHDPGIANRADRVVRLHDGRVAT